MKEEEIVHWHHRLDGHEFKQAPGDSEGQRSLACCSPWGCRVGHDLATLQQEQQDGSTLPFFLFFLHSRLTWLLLSFAGPPITLPVKTSTTC